MRKHLFLAHSAAPSGAELGLLRLSEQLPRDEIVVVFAEDGLLIDKFRKSGINVIVREAEVDKIRRGEGNVWRRLRAVAGFLRYGWSLGQWAMESDVTLVIAYSLKSLLYGSVAAARARVPLVWSVHDRVSSDYFRRIDALLIRTIGRILPRAYIVNSQATLSTVWTGRKPTIISPPGISTSNELCTSRDRSRGLSQIAMVGRLAPWKGQLLFIEAFSRVFKGTDVTATIVGDALFGEHEYVAQVHSSALRSECADQIKLTGNVSNVSSILLNSQILVHASIIPEPFGAVVTEGMNAGCAVIATTPGGPAEVITNGHDGILVPCGDIDAMVSALRLLATDQELREKLAENGVIRAQDFDIRTIARSLSIWLDGVESGKPPAVSR